MTTPNDMPRTTEDELALARLALARRFRSLALPQQVLVCDELNRIIHDVIPRVEGIRQTKTFSRTHNMDASAIVCFHKYLDDAREELRAEGRAQ